MASKSDLTSKSPVALCLLCRHLDFHSPLPRDDVEMPLGEFWPFITFSRSFSGFGKSADRGCPVCWVLAGVCRSWDDLIEPATEIFVGLDDDGDVQVSCRNYQPCLHIYVPRENCSCVPMERTSPFESIPVRSEISESPWSESAQKFARDCIRSCVQGHDLCELGDSLLPTRVIEVGKSGDEQLRLCETKGRVRGQYTALSYCWGSDQTLKTTSGNVKDMMSGQLRLSKLPQTLADAVHLTRSLGIQYLWVDALCIIQDNIEDWEKESEQMSHIYENAHVVIAASSSSSVTQGFLNHQRQRHSHYFDIPATYGTQPRVAARGNPQSGLHSPDKETDPLAQRAWAFQEQHMSTRCLIFSADELQWVCKTKFACECGLTSNPAGPAFCHPLLLAYCNDKTQQEDEPIDQLALQDVWRKAVSEYSSRKLTRPEDKLPAFSGLASRFGAKMGYRYLAGLWEENIIQDLAWTCLSSLLGSEVTPLPTGYRAPSFSWASINDRVCYFFSVYHQSWRWTSCSSVCEARAVVPGHNPFGKVTDAWITIQGPMVRGIIEHEHEHELGRDVERSRFCSDDRKISLLLHADCALTEFSYSTGSNDDERSVRRCRTSTPSEFSTREAPKDHHASPGAAGPSQANEAVHPGVARASVWLLHLGRWTKNEAESQAAGDETSHDYYLVLGKSARDPQSYERIGSCNTLTDEPLDKHGEGFTTRTITIL